VLVLVLAFVTVALEAIGNRCVEKCDLRDGGDFVCGTRVARNEGKRRIAFKGSLDRPLSVWSDFRMVRWRGRRE